MIVKERSKLGCALPYKEKKKTNAFIRVLEKRLLWKQEEVKGPIKRWW